MDMQMRLRYASTTRWQEVPMALVIEGEERIEAPIAEGVGSAQRSLTVLKECIPGCQSLEKTSDTDLAATVVLKIGPIKATFNGEVTLNNLKPP